MENEEPKRAYRAAIHHYESKEGPCLAIFDLIRVAMENSKPEDRLALAEYILAQKEFGEAIAYTIRGHNDKEWSEMGRGNFRSADPLREALLPHAQAGAVELVKSVLEENHRLRERLDTREKHIQKILEDWPEPYKKYIPKEPWVYSSLSITDSQAQKLIDYAKVDNQPR